MAQEAEKKYKHGSENFPILYEDTRVRIYKNPSDEIFVESISSNVAMRISPLRGVGLMFTTKERVEPTWINNMIGWVITPR